MQTCQLSHFSLETSALETLIHLQHKFLILLKTLNFEGIQTGLYPSTFFIKDWILRLLACSTLLVPIDKLVPPATLGSIKVQTEILIFFPLCFPDFYPAKAHKFSRLELWISALISVAMQMYAIIQKHEGQCNSKIP